MPAHPFKLNHLELASWLLQALLLGLAFRKPRRMGQDRRTSVLVCAFAILLGWNWRLIYEFALASSGFWYFVADDPARWLLSWSWRQNPYFLTWDGIWQGGTFYLHGAAMRLTGDPIMASKFVSAFYSLLPLVGLFFLAQGLYRSRKFSCAVVLFAAPLWLHLLLGTGTLAEMPVVGLMLAGVGFLLLSLGEGAGRRNRLELAAAFCFAAATSFHVTAWMMLIPVLLIWLGYAIRNRIDDSSGFKRWLVCAVVSCSYCAAWIVACWVRFGRPLKMFSDYSQHVVRDLGGQLPLSVRIWAYPNAIVYTVLGLLPLVLVGIAIGVFQDSEARHRVRWVLTGACVTLLIMIVSAVRSDPNAHAYRSTVTLASLLLPIALAPLWPLAQEVYLQLQANRDMRAALVAVCLVAFAAVWITDNHQRTIRAQRELDALYSDSMGLGAWLHQEFVRPQLLEIAPGTPPIRLWNPKPPSLGDYGILYAADYPGRLQRWTEQKDPGLDSMTRGQYLITNEILDDPRLQRKWEFGRYTVYQFSPSP